MSESDASYEHRQTRDLYQSKLTVALLHDTDRFQCEDEQPPPISTRFEHFARHIFNKSGLVDLSSRFIVLISEVQHPLYASTAFAVLTLRTYCIYIFPQS